MIKSVFNKRKIRSAILSIISASIILVIFQNCGKGLERASILSSLSSSNNSSSSSVVLESGSGKSQILRLSNLEYKNSVKDSIVYQFARQSAAATSAANINNLIKDSLSALPADLPTMRLGTTQLYASQISTDRFNAYTNVAYAVATNVTSSATTLKEFVGSCATSNTDISNTTCMDNFITNYGSLLFRTPPKATEITELKKGITSWSDLIGRMLIHPRFITHFEREGKINSDGSYQMTAYEVEARLASVFWKSIPDTDGLKAASTGAVLTAAGIKTEVTRMLSSQKSKDAMWEFYQEWLGAGRLPGSFDPGAAFAAFANPISINAINSASFKQAVLQDSRDFIEYITWQNLGSVNDIFKSPIIMTMDNTVASIYGVSARTSSSQAPIIDKSGKYLGILTRPIITQQKPGTNGVANHVQRGVLFMSNLLGIQLGLPANFAEQQQLSSSVPANASSMTEVKIKTSPANCMACHSAINPTGFILANYDSLGRYNDTEKRYSVDSTGAVVIAAQNPIDPTSNIVIDGKSYTVTGPASFADALISSGKLYEGYSKYYFRFAFGRIEDTSLDKGIIDQLKTNLKSGSIQNALINMSLHPDFLKSRPN